MAKGIAGDGGFEALRIENLSRRFGAVAALHDLSLTVARGEFIALLGPSGCGKSTALNCIAGLLPLSSGRIMLDDRRVDTLPPERRGFGMVFQNYALFPHMTVRRNIGFGLAMRRTPRAEAGKRVEAALRLVQLAGHGDKLPGQLSGGQQQRVAIARAIAVNPPLILMDEPLSNLDAKLRIEMRQEIRRIHGEVRRTTIYVTHDQDEALSLADRIVVMQDGVVQQVGTPEALYARPANLAVARFMGFRNLLAFDRAVSLGGSRVRLERGGTALIATLQAGRAGGPATAAVRPEEITVGTGANSVEARVTAAEYCGRDYLVEAETALGSLHARVPQRVAVGDTVGLVLPPDRVLAFADGPAAMPAPALATAAA
jgi:putative spermidine/putrescine transport system ATP-binding protein